METGLLHIRCEISLRKYQDQLLRLEDKLESGLYCELTDKTLHDGYIEYTLLYDMIANCITIDDVKAENGGLRLMKNLTWEYDALPHTLICGGTGGGKTCFLVGNNQMYHAGNPIGYTDLTSAYWQQHIICAGRIKQ